MSILDDAQAQSNKESALSKVASAHANWLGIARQEALAIAAVKGTVTADDVRAVLYTQGLKPDHFNAWGAVFRTDDFQFTGEYRRSAVPEGKGNMQRVWRAA